MNYRADSDSLLTATSLLEEFQSTCTEKENILLTPTELGFVMKELFPHVKRVQRRVNGVRMWHYTISKIDQTSEVSLVWEDLPKFVSDLVWNLSARETNFFEWTRCHPQYSCNSRRIVYEVVIYRDRAFTVKVDGNKVSEETLGISNLGSSKRKILCLFRVLSELSLCKGFPVFSKIIPKDTKGNTIGRTEEWFNRVDNSVFQTVRSLSCRILLQNDYKRSTNAICNHCSQIKRNCSVTSVSGDGTCLKKRESYMSNHELLDKLRNEQARRRKAE